MTETVEPTKGRQSAKNFLEWMISEGVSRANEEYIRRVKNGINSKATVSLEQSGLLMSMILEAFEEKPRSMITAGTIANFANGCGE